jgi:hypothetical protein
LIVPILPSLMISTRSSTWNIKQFSFQFEVSFCFSIGGTSFALNKNRNSFMISIDG